MLICDKFIYFVSTSDKTDIDFFQANKNKLKARNLAIVQWPKKCQIKKGGGGKRKPKWWKNAI